MNPFRGKYAPKLHNKTPPKRESQSLSDRFGMITWIDEFDDPVIAPPAALTQGLLTRAETFRKAEALEHFHEVRKLKLNNQYGGVAW
ncbi:hypothetical protein LP414_27655 [Polaromonas sp. P1(28)-13]|nr:hypothetical protein LP414_27655 [Polaromonas sp. P1(28)-13]